MLEIFGESESGENKVVRTPSMLTMSSALDIPNTIVREMNFFSASDDEILPFGVQIEEFFNESWS